MPAILHVEGLNKTYGEGASATPVLRSVDLTVEAGEFVCVMGPSGSGKSTLLHLIAGLDEAGEGTVELDGQDLSRLSGRERTLLRRRTVGYVFQFFNLLPNLTVSENVALPLLIEGRPKAEQAHIVQPLLERFDIQGRAHARPHQLSGGEMQRTSIARALAAGKPLLLCDEPTGNLSQKAGQEVMETLRAVCDEDGRTILLVTHNPRDAAFADTVRFLVDGKIEREHVLRGPGLTVEDVHGSLSALSI